MTFNSGQNGGKAGVNAVSWNGRTLFGEVGGNGMYVYKIVSGNKVLGSSKIVILD
jgi:flagellar hook assembly protein FlgD